MKKQLISVIFLFLLIGCTTDKTIEPFSLRQEILGYKFSGSLKFYSIPIDNGFINDIFDNTTVSINRGGIRDPYYFLLVEDANGKEVFQTIIEILEDETFKLEYQNVSELYSGTGSYDTTTKLLKFIIKTPKGATISFEGKRK